MTDFVETNHSMNQQLFFWFRWQDGKLLKEDSNNHHCSKFYVVLSSPVGEQICEVVFGFGLLVWMVEVVILVLLELIVLSVQVQVSKMSSKGKLKQLMGLKMVLKSQSVTSRCYHFHVLLVTVYLFVVFFECHGSQLVTHVTVDLVQHGIQLHVEELGTADVEKQEEELRLMGLAITLDLMEGSVLYLPRSGPANNFRDVGERVHSKMLFLR